MQNDILSDIDEQPERLVEALRAHVATGSQLDAAVCGLQQAQLRRIVLTGMGSSFFACYPAFLRLFEAGFAVSWIELSELLHWGGDIGRATALVLVSQSGETVEAVRLLADRSIAGPIVAVTNTLDSTLVQRATYVVPLYAGPEQTVATKSYTTSLLALALLAGRLAGVSAGALAEGLSPTIDAVAQVCAGGSESIAHLSPAWRDAGPITLVGRGPSFATALAGGLLLKETAKISAEGLSCAQFRHGPIEIAGPGHRAIVCGEPGATLQLDARLAGELASHGSRVLLLGSTGGVDLPDVETVELPSTSLAPLVQIIPLQLLAREMALRQGIAPASFRYGSKVTTRE
jgi:glucosamine--fructose-6-phosphate aminotransferase (isomerizing)